MRVVIFCHTLISDWNHGNAHFLRGIVSDLLARGFDVRVFEPADAWSVANLVSDYGTEPLEKFEAAYPQLSSTRYQPENLDLEAALDGAQIVLVHEWNSPELVRDIGLHRKRSGRYALLFHDTHHRSVTEPSAMSRYDLEHYDGVLAFGNSVAEQYRRRGWARRVWTWHEAADIRMFHPLASDNIGDMIWVGNWGDGERTAELHQFLIEPAKELALKARVHGVRYPAEAVTALHDAGIAYGGWLPNFEAPRVFAGYRFTVHVPRRPYAMALPGVPTIRVFEALACGIPLISAPWNDAEGLFTPGEDFLVARTGNEMKAHIRMLLGNPAAGAALAARGLETIKSRHTCGHRVDELLGIYGQLTHAATVSAGGD